MIQGNSNLVDEQEPSSSRADYIFIKTTGQGNPQNDTIRRSHVMRTSFRHRTTTQTPAIGIQSQPLASISAGKRSFRLSRQQLQQHQPYDKVQSESITSGSGEVPRNATQIEPGEQGQSRTSSISADTLSLDVTQGLLRLSTSPLLIFGISRIDPLGVLPVKLSPWDEVLIDRFCHYKKWPWCPINGQSLWSPFALSDELVFSATMYCWSTGFGSRLAGSEASSWIQNNPGIIQHKLSAISLINKRIADSAQAVRDETIAAVAAITNLELLFGTREAAAKHMQGLRTLIRMRGGFSTFVTGLQLLIQRLVSWTDTIHSGLFGTELTFPPCEIWDVSWSTLEQVSLPGSLIGLSPSNLQASGISHHEVVDILNVTRVLCHEEEKRPLRTLDEHGRMQRADMFLKIENRLMAVLQAMASTSAESWSATSLVWKTIALATLVFVHHCLRHSPLRLPHYRVLVPQLHQALLGMQESFQELAFARSLLFWTLSVGVMTSAGMDCNVWFIEKLAETCTTYSMSWQALRSLLMDCLWTGPADEERYLAVWRAVERVQAA